MESELYSTDSSALTETILKLPKYASARIELECETLYINKNFQEDHFKQISDEI